MVWFVATSSLVVVLVIGWHFGRRGNAAEYFLGGGKLNASAAGVSGAISVVSCISFIMVPGEIVRLGPSVATAEVVVMPLVFWFGAWWLRRLPKDALTPFERVRRVHGAGMGRAAALLFILMRLSWMGLLLHAAGIGLGTLLGVNTTVQHLLVFVLGILAMAYSSVGGLRSIVVTDVFQAVVLVASAVAVIAFAAAMLPSDMSTFHWPSYWETPPLLSLRPKSRSVVGALLSSGSWWLCALLADQVLLQRYFAAGEKRVRALGVQLVAGTVIWSLLAVVGFVLALLYAARPDVFGGLALTEADTFFPYFVANALPPAARGLVLAAFFAATMSSVDSGLNSVALIWQRDVQGLEPEALSVRRGARSTLVVATLVLTWAFLANFIAESVFELTARTTNLLLAPLACLVALSWQRSRRLAWLVTATSLVAALLVSFPGTARSFGVHLPAVDVVWIRPLALASAAVVVVIALVGRRARPTASG